MVLEKIPLGRTLEIFVEREEYRYHLISKVEDTNENRVCVTAIASNGRFFNFLPSDKVRIVYRDENSMWEWEMVKPGLARLEGYPVHYFQITNKGHTFNRRNAYRVKLIEEVAVKYFQMPGTPETFFSLPEKPDYETSMTDEEWEEKAANPEVVKAIIKDVSENGIGIYCDKKFREDDEIFFDIPSPYGELAVKATIVRKIKMQSAESRYDYYYGCTFVQSDRKLLRYIYDLQREFLKRQKFMEEQKKAQQRAQQIARNKEQNKEENKEQSKEQNKE